MTPIQPTATTTEALRLPEGTLSMQGNDITIAYATREDAERAFDVLEAALSTAPSGDGVPCMVATDAFARWLEDGPRLAKAAGCYVGIKVSALSTASSTGKETP